MANILTWQSMPADITLEVLLYFLGEEKQHTIYVRSFGSDPAPAKDFSVCHLAKVFNLSAKEALLYASKYANLAIQNNSDVHELATALKSIDKLDHITQLFLGPNFHNIQLGTHLMPSQPRMRPLALALPNLRTITLTRDLSNTIDGRTHHFWVSAESVLHSLATYEARQCEESGENIWRAPQVTRNTIEWCAAMFNPHREIEAGELDQSSTQVFLQTITEMQSLDPGYPTNLWQWFPKMISACDDVCLEFTIPISLNIHDCISGDVIFSTHKV